MRQWGIVLAASGIMLIGFLASLAMFGDQGRIKQILATHVALQTGRQLSIDGAVSVRFFPRLTIQADQVRLSGPSDFEGPDLISSDRLLVEVQVLPLIIGRVETRSMAMQGARVHLGMDDQGAHSLGGLMLRPGREGAPGISAAGPLRLEDVAIEIGALGLGAVRQIQVDRIDLDGLVFDRSLNLRFAGSIGRPPLISEVSVDGVLFVPAATGAFRLADMRFAGRHPDARLPFELLGAVSFSAIPPLDIRLDPSRLRIADQELVLQGSYRGLDRPRFSLSAAAGGLDGFTLAGVFAPHAAGNWPIWLANAVAEHDFELQMAVDRLLLGPYTLSGVHLSLEALQGRGQWVLAEVALPGGLMQGSGRVDAVESDPQIEMRVTLDVDDLGALLRGGQFAFDADGAGEVRITPISMPGDDGWLDAEFSFFAGRWPGLSTLRRQSGLAGHDHFETLEAKVRLHADTVIIASMTIRDDVSEVHLKDAIWHRSGRWSGQVLVHAEDRTLQFELSGSGAAPEFTPIVSMTPGQ